MLTNNNLPGMLPVFPSEARCRRGYRRWRRQVSHRAPTTPAAPGTGMVHRNASPVDNKRQVWDRGTEMHHLWTINARYGAGHRNASPVDNQR